MISPVEQFYLDIEILREKEREEALLPAVARRGRPRKKKLYFTDETEMAIIAYNVEENQRLKNKVYNEFIKHPFEKLSENIIHTFKFYYFDGGTREVQQEVIAFLIEKMNKFTPGKGKAFSYFGQITKNYLIQNNNKNYKELINKSPITVIDLKRDLGAEEALQDKREGLDMFMDSFVLYYDKQIEEKFKSQRDKKIAYATLKLFEDRKSIEIFNKKALYILIREMTNTKTQHITKVVNVIKVDFKNLYKRFENGTYF
tara:strand:- start:2416 stop:3189 length:774 start_codon:yes stop_codon:yes gene_type:complete